jgi:hypothetical protein
MGLVGVSLPSDTPHTQCINSQLLLLGPSHDALGAWLEPAKLAAAAQAALYHYLAPAKACHPCLIRGGSLSLRRQVLCVVVVVYRDTACLLRGSANTKPFAAVYCSKTSTALVFVKPTTHTAYKAILLVFVACTLGPRV